MSPERIHLVVVDDHALFRKGLISLLADMAEFDVVAEADNGQEGLAQVQQYHPDVVLLDINMPVLDGIETVKALRRSGEDVPILMLTISQNDQDLVAAIKAGADGYLLKNAEPEDLRKAILHVAQGEGVLSPEITGAVLKALAKSMPEGANMQLSERELEVLNCMADGMKTQDIASTLFVSENTVKTHIRHIFEKLEVSRRVEAVSKAIQLGLIRQRDDG